jgi:hypothetical protein
MQRMGPFADRTNRRIWHPSIRIDRATETLDIQAPLAPATPTNAHPTATIRSCGVTTSPAPAADSFSNLSVWVPDHPAREADSGEKPYE